MEPVVIRRQGDYHADNPDSQNPSATALRRMMKLGGNWLAYVPESAHKPFTDATVHTLKAGEKAVLARLRTMTEADFEALPHGSEGLWRKFMHAVHTHATLEEILSSVKSKRYTRTRIDRMMMCAYLGITREMLHTPAPYTRVLAFNDKGREILKLARQNGMFINAGEKTDTEYEALETKCGALYTLFANDPGSPSLEQKRRIKHL